MPDNYGLDRNVMFKITDVFKKYSHYIDSVILYGSRARGDYKFSSDIDLAIKFRSDENKITEIRDALEQIDTIFDFDVIDYNEVENRILINSINAKGIEIFKTDDQGGVRLNIDKLYYKLADLKKAFKKLTESINRDPYKDDIVVDAAIQRFEFTYELSWKLMKAYLEYNGNLEATSPRKAIKESFKDGLIRDGEVWLQMLQDRNRTAHTYDEETALKIFKNIKNNYIQSFDQFIKKLEKEIKS